MSRRIKVAAALALATMAFVPLQRAAADSLDKYVTALKSAGSGKWIEVVKSLDPGEWKSFADGDQRYITDFGKKTFYPHLGRANAILQSVAAGGATANTGDVNEAISELQASIGSKKSSARRSAYALLGHALELRGDESALDSFYTDLRRSRQMLPPKDDDAAVAVLGSAAGQVESWFTIASRNSVARITGFTAVDDPKAGRVRITAKIKPADVQVASWQLLVDGEEVKLRQSGSDLEWDTVNPDLKDGTYELKLRANIHTDNDPTRETLGRMVKVENPAPQAVVDIQATRQAANVTLHTTRRLDGTRLNLQLGSATATLLDLTKLDVRPDPVTDPRLPDFQWRFSYSASYRLYPPPPGFKGRVELPAAQGGITYSGMPVAFRDIRVEQPPTPPVFTIKAPAVAVPGKARIIRLVAQKSELNNAPELGDALISVTSADDLLTQAVPVGPPTRDGEDAVRDYTLTLAPSGKEGLARIGVTLNGAPFNCGGDREFRVFTHGPRLVHCYTDPSPAVAGSPATLFLMFDRPLAASPRCNLGQLTATKDKPGCYELSLTPSGPGPLQVTVDSSELLRDELGLDVDTSLLAKNGLLPEVIKNPAPSVRVRLAEGQTAVTYSLASREYYLQGPEGLQCSVQWKIRLPGGQELSVGKPAKVVAVPKRVGTPLPGAKGYTPDVEAFLKDQGLPREFGAYMMFPVIKDAKGNIVVTNPIEVDLAESRHKRFALIIGFGYDKSTLNKLSGIRFDVEDLYRKLTVSYGYDPLHVRVITDVNPAQCTGVPSSRIQSVSRGSDATDAIAEAVKEFRNAGAEYLLLAYTGHGTKTEQGDALLYPDWDKQKPSTYLPVTTLCNQLCARADGHPFRHVLLILDACRSSENGNGGLEPFDVKQGSSLPELDVPDGRSETLTVLFASSAGEESLDVELPKDPPLDFRGGLFLHMFLRELERTPWRSTASHRRDDWQELILSLQDQVKRLATQVRADHLQTPTLKFTPPTKAHLTLPGFFDLPTAAARDQN